MKCIVISVLVCVAALEAKPQPYLGLNGLGMAGLGSGYGNGMLGMGMQGLGLGAGGLGGLGGLGGIGTSGLGYSQGGGYGSNQFNSGAGGLANQLMHTGGMGNFHDVGQHHSSLSSITQAENTDNHNIGGGQVFDTGALSGTGFNQFGNGGSRYGNGFGSGQLMNSFI
ncbi:acanthoscurrin-2-like [Danaus plexippus]|uniref:acanthoscurrin-2-like n=1 Tax=Danaus plexippus TaxID=13037 RepID=UPI002AB1B9CB|nr:acanthoscurrin-2-like [Danaus plexippus]